MPEKIEIIRISMDELSKALNLKDGCKIIEVYVKERTFYNHFKGEVIDIKVTNGQYEVHPGWDYPITNFEEAGHLINA